MEHFRPKLLTQAVALFHSIPAQPATHGCEGRSSAARGLAHSRGTSPSTRPQNSCTSSPHRRQTPYEPCCMRSSSQWACWALPSGWRSGHCGPRSAAFWASVRSSPEGTPLLAGRGHDQDARLPRPRGLEIHRFLTISSKNFLNLQRQVGPFGHFWQPPSDGLDHRSAAAWLRDIVVSISSRQGLPRPPSSHTTHVDLERYFGR